MGRRTLLLIAALVVAALGTVLIFIYVQGADDRAQEDATLVEVLVATQQVEAGTTAADASGSGAFEIQEVPDSARADGALTDVSIVSDQVALSPIFPGQQILAQMFGAPGTNAALSVPKNKLAMSVQLGDPERVAGFVVPGSQVTIFYTPNTGDPTVVVIPKVNVLATGATTLSTQVTTTEEGESTTEEIPQAILTLETDQEQAQRIINGQTNGALYFGLLGPGTVTRSGVPTFSQDLLK